MSLPKYPEYKDSGVVWIGEVPRHWGVHRLKTKLALLTEKAARRSHPVALENIESWSGRFVATEGEFGGEGVAFSAGDILFGKLRPYLAKAYLAERPGEAVGDFHVLRPTQDIDGRFVQYQILTQSFINVIDSTTFGSKMPRASWEALGNMALLVPQTSEQKTIAAFLDRETAKIDTLIAEQEKLINLLAEKRQATISHAVMRGLNPDVPMKDSGVAWLGEVPAHWDVTQLKRLCARITDGAHISPETEGGEYCFVSTKDLIGDEIDFDGCLLTSPESFEYLLKTGCKPYKGDVLFSKDGTIGRTVVVREEREFVVASSLIIISPLKGLVDSGYLNFLCKSAVVVRQVESFIKGAGLPRLSIQNLLKVIGIFPPLDEQLEITEFLNNETAKLDALKSEAGRAIVLLKERRSALIAAAVTGQIDVRGAVVQPAFSAEVGAA